MIDRTQKECDIIVAQWSLGPFFSIEIGTNGLFGRGLIIVPHTALR